MVSNVQIYLITVLNLKLYQIVSNETPTQRDWLKSFEIHYKALIKGHITT